MLMLERATANWPSVGLSACQTALRDASAAQRRSGAHRLVCMPYVAAVTPSVTPRQRARAAARCCLDAGCLLTRHCPACRTPSRCSSSLSGARRPAPVDALRVAAGLLVDAPACMPLVCACRTPGGSSCGCVLAAWHQAPTCAPCRGPLGNAGHGFALSRTQHVHWRSARFAPHSSALTSRCLSSSSVISDITCSLRGGMCPLHGVRCVLHGARYMVLAGCKRSLLTQASGEAAPLSGTPAPAGSAAAARAPRR